MKALTNYPVWEVSGKTVYRRDFRKSDGLNLSLYGFHPHIEQALAETEPAFAANRSQLRWHPLRREWNIYAAHRQNRVFKPGIAEDPLALPRGSPARTEIPFTQFELAVFDNKFSALNKAANSKIQNKSHDLRNREALGVTLHHPYGQIYAFPFIPKVQASAVSAFEEGFDLQVKRKDWRPDYEISHQGGISAFCPPFARFPYEVWLAPLAKRHGLWDMTEEEKSGFAASLGEICARYDQYFGCETPYMLSLHAAPRHHPLAYHFTAQFYPLLRAPGRLKYLASVEQSTGVFTVDVIPEKAVVELRAVQL